MLRESLPDTLDAMLQDANGAPVSLRSISSHLADKGYAMLFVVLSFPFCFPITVPGLSSPMGLLIAVLGLRFSLKKPAWWPQWILAKEIPFDKFKVVVQKAKTISATIQRVMYPRMTFLIFPPFMQVMHGLLICALSLLLALPLPLPFTNTFASVPIFILGLALLEHDGLAVLVAYAAALVGFTAFGLLFWFGDEGIHWVWVKMSLLFSSTNP